MFARITDLQGKTVATIDRHIEVERDGEIWDRFIDENSNLYLERPHEQEMDALEIMFCIREVVTRFYQLENFHIHIGQTH